MRVTVDDAAIDVATDGNGDAIVLIHAFPYGRDLWDAQAAKLSQSMLTIRPDLRGMGRSSVPDGPYLMETLAGDIAGILDTMGIDRATLVGHSVGGYVALAFCRMYTERVKRLALVCSRLGADTPETAENREKLAERAERDRSMEAIVEAYLPRQFTPENLQTRPDIVERAREIALRNDPRGAAAMLRGMAQRLDSYDIAEELRMPVLIVAGAADPFSPPDEAREMARAFADAEVRVMERSAHLPLLEEPDALNEVLLRFLER